MRRCLVLTAFLLLIPVSAHADPPPSSGAVNVWAAANAAVFVQRVNEYAWASALAAKERATAERAAKVPAPAPRASSAPRSPAPASDSGVWDRIAACESGGNWATNTGNGYYGGLQMDMAFWRNYGGPAFASRPDLASREQQIVVAERARDSGRGYSPWPVCGKRA